MKSLFFTPFFILFSNSFYAQEVNNILVKEIPAKYIEIQIIPKTLFDRAYVSVDYGQVDKKMSKKEIKNITILKQNNVEIDFFTNVSLLNFFYDNGFKLIESYQNIETNSSHEVTANLRKYLLENLNY